MVWDGQLIPIMHVLVKWPRISVLDVYPVERVVDVDIGLRLLDSPASSVEQLKGKKVSIRWDPEEDPSQAFIIAAGTADVLERRRLKVLKAIELCAGFCDENDPPQVDTSCSRCDSTKRRVEELEKENEKLARRLRKAKKKIDRMQERAQEAVTVVESPKVDIGLGVLVDTCILNRVEAGARGDGTKLARSLLRVVFAPEELVGRTLFGGRCNAQKENPVKPALDPTRVNAVIEEVLPPLVTSDKAHHSSLQYLHQYLHLQDTHAGRQPLTQCGSRAVLRRC